MAHDIFISYSKQDKNVANAVCATLESRKCRCWIAPRDVIPGMDWAEMIIDAIMDSSIVVLILSSNSNDSRNVLREIRYAVDRGAIILPFRIEDVLPGKSLQFFLGPQHWLDALTPPLEDHLSRLADTVCLLLKQEHSVTTNQERENSLCIDSETPRQDPVYCPTCDASRDVLNLADEAYCSVCGAILLKACTSPLGRTDAKVEARLCMSCGAKSVPRFVDDNPICSKCGAELSRSAASLIPDGQAVVQCPLCFSDLPPTVVLGKAHCSNCGSPLPEKAEATQKPDEPPAKAPCRMCGCSRVVSVGNLKYCAECGNLLRTEGE